MQRGIEPRRRSKSIPLPKSVDLNRTALLLDVDGTLLDIASTPDGVVVPASLNATLERLLAQTGGTVALVSGRTIPMLDRLFQPLKLPAIGGHGAEMRLALATRSGRPSASCRTAVARAGGRSVTAIPPI